MQETLQNWEALVLPGDVLAGTAFVAVVGHFILFYTGPVRAARSSAGPRRK